MRSTFQGAKAVGRKAMTAKKYFTIWYWFYYFFAQVCPLLRRT